MLCPPAYVLPGENLQLPPLLLAMMVLVTAVTGVRSPKETAPPDAAAVFAAMVQLVIVTSPRRGRALRPAHWLQSRYCR